MKRLIIIAMLLLAACTQNEIIDIEDQNLSVPDESVVEPIKEVIEPVADEVEPTELSVNYREGENIYDYGSSQDHEYVKLAKEHCERKEGEFDQCGSACPPGEFCAAVCVLTCDVSDKKTKHVVKIQDLSFSPKVLTINKGDTVEFINTDNVSHTATANGGYFASPLLGKGQSWHFTFKDSGSYQYHSSPYRVTKGEIFVKD